MLGQKYTAAWGQQVVIDHRAGAGMTIGIDLAAKSAPDGYTLVLVNPSHAINATLMPKLPYDPVRDLTPVTTVATQPYGMVVSATTPGEDGEGGYRPRKSEAARDQLCVIRQRIGVTSRGRDVRAWQACR